MADKFTEEELEIIVSQFAGKATGNTIDAESLRNLLTSESLDPAKVDSVLNKAKFDQDGNIAIADFLNMIK